MTMDTDRLGIIARDVNLNLVRMGLTDAEVSFVGMCLMSYAIGKTIASMQRNPLQTEGD